MKSADGRAAARRVALAGLAAAVALAVGMGLVGCEPAGEGDLDLAVYALESCSQSGGVGAPASARVVVRGPQPCEDDAEKTCVDELASAKAKWGGTVEVGGIPEGADREVTILAYSGGDASGTPIGFARATGVTIRRGESTPVEAVLARFGGVSCPGDTAGFTQRVFATATPVDGDEVVIAGGFTGAEGDQLVSPDNGVYIYDSKTGAVTRVEGGMAKARGGHAAAYIPNMGERGWVVFFGGAASLGWSAAGESVPVGFDAAASDGAFDDFEVFDVATRKFVVGECSQGCQACCEEDGTPVEDPQPACVEQPQDCQACRRGSARAMARGRVLAQPAVMSDGFVVITGGGDFPAHDVSDYRIAEVFDPGANCLTGGFQPAATAPRMENIRAGHTLTFIETTEAGRYRFLLWGGTKERTESGGTFSLGETYTESSQQAKLISGVFRQVAVNDTDLAPSLYFHSMTPLTDRRFLLAGGVRLEGGQFEGPKAEDLYVLKLEGTDTYTATITRVPDGLGTGRFLHSGTTHDARNVLLFGGFSDLGGAALAEPRAFDVQANAFVTLTGTPPLARGAHGAVVLSDDTTLLVGGLQQSGDLDGAEGLFEVYTPSLLSPLAGN